MHSLELTDGTTTIRLGDAYLFHDEFTDNVPNHKILSYVPRSPDLSTVDFTPEALRDGGERISVTRRNVTESAAIMFVDTTTDYVRADIEAVEAMLRAAEEYQSRRAGSPVYVQYQPGATGEVYRSEVLSGKVDLDDVAMNAEQFGNTIVRALVVWTRRYYWEGAEAEIPLKNANGSGAGGRTVYNHAEIYQAATISFDSAAKKISDSASGMVRFKTGEKLLVVGSVSNDGNYTLAVGGTAAYVTVNETLVTESAGAAITLEGQNSHFVEIQAADVVGSLPSPLRLEITNNYTDAAHYAKILWAGHNVFSSPRLWNPIIEAEDGAQPSSPPAGYSRTVVSNVSYSGSKYVGVGWTADAESDLLVWTLSSAFLTRCGGQYFRVMAQVTLGDTNTKHRLKLQRGSAVIWQGPQVKKSISSYQFIELGILRLPPLIVGTSTHAALSLVWTGEKVGGAAYNVDYLALMPLDGYRKYVPSGRGLENAAGTGDRLVDDGTSDLIWVDTGADTARSALYVAAGKPFAVWPGKLQRLYVLGTIDDNTSPPWRTLSLRAYYRPRRLTV